MSKLIKGLFKKYWGVAGVILICLILVLSWFSRYSLFGGGESRIPFYNLTKYANAVSYLWYEFDTGYPVLDDLSSVPIFRALSWLSSLGFNNIFLQASTFFILLSCGSLSVYFLIKETFNKNLSEKFVLMSFTAAVFYILNPLSMTEVWGRGLMNQFFTFALAPLFLVLFILGLNRRNFFYLILADLSCFALSTSFANPSQVVVVWFPVLIYFFYFIWRNKKKGIIFSVSYLILLIFFWILVNAWWLIPYYLNGTKFLSSFLSIPGENLETLRSVSRQSPLQSLIRLIHNGPLYEGKYYGDSYLTIPFVLLSWLIPLIAIFSISTFKKVDSFKFYLILFLGSLFVVLGSNFPLGFLFELLFVNLPFLQAFRNPLEKFGVVYLLSYTPFFALGAVVLAEKLKNHYKKKLLTKVIPLVILILICGIFSWPMWTGYFAGGFVFNPWVKVPDYYQAADNWLNQQPGDFRIINLPLARGDGIVYDWPHYYAGIAPCEDLFTKPSICRNAPLVKPYYNVLLQRFDRFQPLIFGPDPDLTHSDFKSEKFYRELAKLNVRYIVLHHDIHFEKNEPGATFDYVSYLSSQQNINKVASFGKLDVYQVAIDKNIKILYSPEIETSFYQKDPTYYVLNVKNNNAPFSLYFLELFDHDWQAYINGQNINTHGQIFSYANAWKISQQGDFQVTVKYQPQDIVNFGIKVSQLAATLLIAALVLKIIYSWRAKLLRNT